MDPADRVDPADRMDPADPTPPPPSRSRARKWLVALVVTVVLGGLAYWVAGVRRALDEGPQRRAVACSKAMSTIGWELPESASDQACTSLTGLRGGTWSGTFRMARADVRPWLASLPGKHGAVDGAAPDGVVEREDGLTLRVEEPPGTPQADEVRVRVHGEGRDGAVVSFETFDF
ncbi:hypothetical protein [Streptomyces cinnamoneus]|nr:hypothetical protein [Streptomyces cinnamoneus]